MRDPNWMGNSKWRVQGNENRTLTTEGCGTRPKDAALKATLQTPKNPPLKTKGGAPEKATADPSAQNAGLVMTTRRLLQG
jgi:hypothetical protein